MRGYSHHAEIAALDVGDPLLHPAFRQDKLVGVFGFDDPGPYGLQKFVAESKGMTLSFIMTDMKLC